MQKFLSVLKDIGELIVFKHSVFALPFIFISMIVASYHLNETPWFGFKLLILGLLCAVSARNFAMAFNRYCDEEIDRLNPRTKDRPSVDGRIGKKNMIIFIVVNALIFIMTAYFINEVAFYCSFPILLVLGGYSLFKRFSSLAHLVLGLSLGLAPIAGSIAVLSYTPMWSWLLCFGVMFWVAGFDLLYSLQDIDYDRKNNLFSIPSRYGWDATFFISSVFHALTSIFWLLFVIEAKLSYISYFAVFVSAVILFAEHKIVRSDFRKIDKAFFILNGYLGIIFFIFVLIDLIFIV